MRCSQISDLFWGFVQTHPLLSFWQYVGIEMKASHNSSFTKSFFLVFVKCASVSVIFEQVRE